MNLGLTIKQQKFCDEYLISGNATDAAVKAGYSKKTARVIGGENLLKPAIKEYLDGKMKELEQSKIASAEEVLQYITSVVRSEGEETKDRIKAAELLSKRYGLLSERLNVTGSVPVVICGEEELED